MDLTAEEILEKFVRFDSRNNNDLIRKDCVINAMEEYAELKWEQACRLQIEACSDKVFDLLNTDDDAETWHNKVLSTDIVEYEE